MQLSRRGVVVAGLAALGLSAAGGRSENTKIETLEGALDDVVQVEIEDRIDDASDDVVLCLVNRAKTGVKGFEIRRATSPRFIASTGAAICTRVAPARHELILWKVAEGGFRPVISAHLDLSNAAGGRALITW